MAVEKMERYILVGVKDSERRVISFFETERAADAYRKLLALEFEDDGMEFKIESVEVSFEEMTGEDIRERL